MIVVVEKIKEYLRNIINQDLDKHNEFTINYSRMRKKVAFDLLEKIEELENT